MENAILLLICKTPDFVTKTFLDATSVSIRVMKFDPSVAMFELLTFTIRALTDEENAGDKYRVVVAVAVVGTVAFVVAAVVAIV